MGSGAGGSSWSAAGAAMDAAARAVELLLPGEGEDHWRRMLVASVNASSLTMVNASNVTIDAGSGEYGSGANATSALLTCREALAARNRAETLRACLALVPPLSTEAVVAMLVAALVSAACLCCCGLIGYRNFYSTDGKGHDLPVTYDPRGEGGEVAYEDVV